MSIARLLMRAKLVDDEGKPVIRRRVTVQWFDIAQNTWINLINLASNEQGEVNSAVARTLENAPMLQLISGESVLSEGGLVNYESRNRTLSVDFGEIELLEGQAYPMTPAAPNNTLKKQIGGLPKRKNISFAPMMGVLTQPGVASFTRSEVLREQLLKDTISKDRVVKGTKEPAIKQIDTSQYRKLLEQVEIDMVRQSLDKGILERQHEQTLRQVKVKDEQILELRKANEKLQQEYKEQKNREVKQLEQRFTSRIEGLIKEKDSMQQQLKTQTNVSTIQQSISAGLEHFSKQQAQSGSHMRLGRVQVNVKGLFSGDGSKITLADSRLLENATNAAALSEMTIEYLPETHEDDSGIAEVP
ncbi:MAG: hypothetical protein EA373_11480, partial [Oceanospirillales bacterium]